MPFIRGRYYMNPVAGEALEAAREAEEALLALHDAGHENEEGEDGGSPDAANAAAGRGPVHRVEIEAAEVVPTHSGRGQRGFVARIHRAGYPGPQDASGDAKFWGEDRSSATDSRAGRDGGPETRVFSDHQDLVNFLRDEFAKDCQR